MTELRIHVSDEVAASLAAEAAERGTSTEAVAAAVLAEHTPAVSSNGRSFAFIGIADARPGALSAADAERRLEDGLDDGFG